MYRYLACLFFTTSVVSAGVLYSDNSQAAPSSSGDSYGQRQETRCTPYWENVAQKRCEPYTERTCTTTQRESCTDVADQNCRAVVSSKQFRKCFNVTEQNCGLREDVQFDTIQVPVVVQKCQRVNERVCNTVYDTSSRIQEENACINLENPQCETVENTIFDRTCKTTTKFDCDTTYPDSYGSSAGPVRSASGGSGSGNAGGYGGDDNSGNDYSTDSSYGGSQNAYGQAQTNCRRTQDTKCYKTPRTVTVQQCTRRTDRVCETLRESQPTVAPRQVCRNEEKKVCDLEERTQPKQVKKYVYSRYCNPVPRAVCENADQKTLVPSCVQVTRKHCTYSPVEQCQDVAKEHCYQVNQRVRRERCETVNVGGYDNSGSSGSGAGGQGYSDGGQSGSEY